MADLLNITTPISPKNYEFSNKYAQQAQTDQVFNLGDTTKVQKATERTEEFANRDNKDGSNMPGISVSVSKNPTAALNILRSIIGTSTASALSSEGDIDVLNKVTEFANEVMLKPTNLASDMAAQEKDATIYNDPIWSEMKELLMNSSEDMGSAVLQFAKAASDASARDDILNSAAADLRYLAGEAAPSRDLANSLMQTADMLNTESFPELKGSILNQLEQLQNSLLMNDETQNLIQLAVYNLSRYNGSASALGESFNAILDMADTQEQADMLRQLFMQYIENANLPSDIKIASLNCIIQGNAPSASALSVLAEKLGAAMNSSNITEEQLEAVLKTIDPAGGTSSLGKTLSVMLPDTMNGALNNILKSYDSTGNIAALVDRLSIMINSIDDMNKKTRLAEKVNTILSGFTISEKDISLTTDSILKQQSLTQLSEKLGVNLNKALGNISLEQLSAILSRLDTTLGAASIRSAFEKLLPQNSTEELNLILRRFNATGDLNKLIDNLSLALDSVKDMDKKIVLAQSINEILSSLTKAEGINYKPPTSMANLMDFLAKNINDPSLKSLSSMSRSDIMQGLLTAPGVFTPLLHYLVPINDGGFKAFGELWADPDADNLNGSKESKHMFLCFEIEDFGYFELELQSQDKQLNINLLCPAGTENVFRSMKNRISEIASANGYNADNTFIGALRKKRDLTQVFPKIQDKRSGLNVKI